MSPKGRKSHNHSWYSCEKCGVLLPQKEIQEHNIDSCPPNEDQWHHAFIRDEVCYSFIEYLNVNDAPKVGIQEKQKFVYLSQSVMQLCHFEIGEDVILTINETSMVRKVWPTTERLITSVILPVLERTVTDLQINQEKCQVKVHKLNNEPTPASHIFLTPCTGFTISSDDQLLKLCKQQYTGKIFCCENELVLQFYGKNIKLFVKDVQIRPDDNLINKFEELNIDKAKKTNFIAVESSIWEFYSSLKNPNSKDPGSKGICLKNVGGYKEITEELLRSINLAFKPNNSTSRYWSSLGILLHGPTGVGKSFITQAIANEMNVHVVQINSGELFSKFYGEAELRLRNAFAEARDKSPSIIILDNVDTLCPKRGGTEQERRIIAYLLTLLDSLKDSRVVVLASTSQLNLIDTALRRPGRFDCEVELYIPLPNDRFDILKVLLSDWIIEDSEIIKIAKAAHGYVAADLQCLVTKALMHATTFGRNNIEASDLIWALSQIKPSAMREVLVQVPNVKWSDIGGMDDLKLKLKQSIEWPLCHPECFSRLGINPPRGILMYGPPGCSKTMIAKALASESNLNFLSMKGSDLFSKWVGESEKAVQSLFRKARAVAPSIIFLDELDALGGERSGSSEGSNVQERVLAQLLTEMDGVEPLGNVNIVAATNRPDRIDKALLRPGRLDRMVYVPLPDFSTRACILQLQLCKMPISKCVVVDELSTKTEGYSGAEVVAVCHEAAINALQENFSITEVCYRHFVAALNIVKPRTPSSLLKLYDTYLKT